MTEHLQPGSHLSPEQLSAFAENVLPEHERLAALTHLAGCADCRQVVFLAQQADPSLTAVPVAPETLRRSWFSMPQIFGAATAALACSLILALIIHQRHTEIPSTTAVTTAQVQQPPALTPPNAPMPAPTPSNPAQISAASTKSDVAAPSLIGHPTPKPVPVPDFAPVPRPQTLGAIGAGTATGQYSEAKQKDKASFDAYSAPAASNYAALPPKAPAGAMGGMPMSAAVAPESHLREGDIAADSIAAPAPPPPPLPLPPPGTNMDATSGTVNAASIENLPLSGRAVLNKATTKPVAPLIQLPSNKPAVSVLHSSGRTLALDTAGALFLSIDLGKHWTAVTPQWSGKVIQISLAATPTRLYLQQPSQNQNQSQSNNSISGSAAASGVPQQQSPIPTAGFDLTTATGAVWHSTDGINWHPR